MISNYEYNYTKIASVQQYNILSLLLVATVKTILSLRVRQPRAAKVCEGDDILRCGTQFNGESRPTGQYSMATCVPPDVAR